MNKLAVIIPSYNRLDKLLVTLRKLCPQIVEGVSVSVIDNCSDTRYETICPELEPVISNYIADGKIKFIRNRYNIGVSANLMRSFETCESDWMWLLADDDDISEDAIAIILNEIDFLKSEDNLAVIKFSSRGCEAKAGGSFITSLNSMIDTLATSVVYFNSFIFTSNNVYRVPRFSKLIEVGYKSLFTYVPHLMMVLYYLDSTKNGNMVFLSDKNIVTYVVPEMGYSYGFVAGLGVGAFKNFPFDLTSEQYLKLENIFAPHNDFKVAIDLFYYAQSCSNMYVARRLFSNYYIQIKSARSVLHRLMIKSFSLLYYVPTIFEWMIDLLSSSSSLLKRHVAEIKKRNQR